MTTRKKSFQTVKKNSIKDHYKFTFFFLKTAKDDEPISISTERNTEIQKAPR